MWPAIISAGASILGGVMQGNAAKRAGEISAEGAREATELQRQIYQDQRNLAMPGYMAGGNALNLLSAQYGLPAQDFGGNAGVAGGPIGATAGSADYAGYVRNNPDLMAEFSKPGVSDMFGGDISQYGQWHASTYGDREVPTYGGQPAGGTGAGGAMTNGLASPSFDPMERFMESPDAKLAQDHFLNFDVPDVNAAFSAGGKLMSGAQKKALSDYGAQRLTGAYGNYTNGLRSIAGQTPVATSQINSAAGAFGVNAGGNAQNAATARASGYAGQQQGFMNGLSGAVGGVLEHGEKKGWWG